MSKRMSKKKPTGRGGRKATASAVKLYAVEQMKLGTNVTALAKKLKVNRGTPYYWYQQFAAESASDNRAALEPMAPEKAEAKRLQSRIAELESAVGRKQVQIDFFQDALRRIEATRSTSGENGGRPSTKRSVRSNRKAY